MTRSFRSLTALLILVLIGTLAFGLSAVGHDVTKSASAKDAAGAGGSARLSMLLASEDTDQVLKYDGVTGRFQRVFAGKGLSGPIQPLYGPNGNLYVTNYESSSVTEYDGRKGDFVRFFVPPGAGGLDGARGVTFGPDDDLYLSSWNNDRVIEYDGDTGEFVRTFVKSGSGGLDGPIISVFSTTARRPPGRNGGRRTRTLGGFRSPHMEEVRCGCAVSFRGA